MLSVSQAVIRRRNRTRENPNDGFSLVEVIVAMVIFGLVAAATAPLILATVVSTNKLSTIASASQAAVTVVDELRRDFSTTVCATAVSNSPAVQNVSEDVRGMELRSTVLVSGTCAARSVAEVTVKISVIGDNFNFNDGQVIHTTQTKVFVEP